MATLIGVVMGLARTSTNLTLQLLSRAYVELIRNIPPVVFIFIFYFFISSQLFPAIGVDRLRPNSPILANPVALVLFGPPNLFANFLSEVVCLAIFEAAYVAEIVRSGVQSVEKGQWEAARAIGLSHTRVLADVILPQALRHSAVARRAVHQPREELGDGVFDLGPGTDIPVERGRLDDPPNLRNVDHRRDVLFRDVSRLLAPLRSSGAPREAGAPLIGTVGQDVAPILVMRDVCKWYAEFCALYAVDLEVLPGERVVVCGPSGSGKSTLIRCVNGLETHERGTIILEGREVDGDPRKITAVRRRVGMVFQQFNLFPHLTVLQNCVLGPVPQPWPSAARRAENLPQ